MNNKIKLGIALLFLSFLGCQKNVEEDKILVFTSIVPYKYIVEQLASERIEVHSLIKAGENAHTFIPKPSQLAQISKAQIYFMSNIEFEKTIIPKIKNNVKDIRIVDLLKEIKLRNMDHKHADHNKGLENQKDPHVWLSPVIFKKQALIIKDELIKLDEKNSELYETNYEHLAKRLDSLDNELKRELGSYKGKRFFVYHPAFGYFADRYGLVQTEVETDGKEPSAKELTRLIKKAKISRPKVIFVQPQYSKRSAQKIAETLGCTVEHINPMPYEYFKEMGKIVKSMKKGLGSE